MNIFKRLLSFSKEHIAKFVISMLCMVIVGAISPLLAYLVKPVVDNVFINKELDMLKWITLAVLVIFLVKNVCSYIQVVLMSYIGQRIITNIRNKLYARIQAQSLDFFTKNPTGMLMSRITNDVSYIQGAVSEAVTSLVKDSFSIVGYVFTLFYLDWKLALIGMIIFPIIIYPLSSIGKMIRRVTTKTQVTFGNLSSLLQETIAGARIVKAFGMESYEEKRFAQENEKLFRLTLKIVSTNAISSPLMDFLGGLGIAAIISYGGYQVINGSSTPGTFFSFLAAIMLLYEPVKRIASVNNTVQQGIAAAERVFEIIDNEPSITDKPAAVPLAKITKKIEFKNVSFNYDESTPILKNINLSIGAGKLVAFVGVSGSGKTTLVNLIPRFYDVSDGTILIDGHDIREVTVESLRSQVGIVTQQTILFNDSIKNNIAYGDRGKDDDAIIQAATAANAHKFIEALPSRYDSIIGEQGTKLSGGEKQRISIARALLKDAPILILDEATSSLDSESELEVQDALENLMQGRTTLMIAHRLSTIRKADIIVVLSAGEIVEMGTHDELFEKCGEYYRLYTLQFSVKQNTDYVND